MRLEQLCEQLSALLETGLQAGRSLAEAAAEVPMFHEEHLALLEAGTRSVAVSEALLEIAESARVDRLLVEVLEDLLVVYDQRIGLALSKALVLWASLAVCGAGLVTLAATSTPHVEILRTLESAL